MGANSPVCVQDQQRPGASPAAAAVDTALLLLAAAWDGREAASPPPAQPLRDQPQRCCCCTHKHMLPHVFIAVHQGGGAGFQATRCLCGSKITYACTRFPGKLKFLESLNAEHGRVSAL